MLGERSIHLGRMPSMEVHRVRVRTLIHEPHAHEIAFGRANGRVLAPDR